TDDRMLPQSLRGYAPVIHGVADTNAKVTVTQNGVQIYQTTVAPGPFTINDLYPTGYGGSLEVTVAEANGRNHSFSVPYASVAQLLRAGTTRYDVAVGRLRSLQILDPPNVAQATLQHGFSNLFTGYAGLQVSRGYTAALIGGAFNTRYGAFAMDLTQAGATIPGYHGQDGQSLRLSYSKIIPDTQTSLSVAAYRYSSSGFLSLTDAASARDYAHRGLSLTQYLPATMQLIDGVPVSTPLTPAQQAILSGQSPGNTTALVATGLVHQRNHFTLSLNQRLGERGGSLYLNSTISDYWNRSGSDRQFQVGYNNMLHGVSYNISATRTRDPFGHYNNRYFVSFSVPLGASSHAPNFTLNVNHDNLSGSQDQGMLTGNLGDDNQFNYGATASHAEGSGGNAVAVNAGYRSPYAVIGASYGKGGNYSQASVNVSGAVVAHPGGVTFGQPTGDTIGIVHAPGAEGARVTNAPGVRIDHAGYALVPYLNPYQRNTIRLDPQGLPLDVQLDSTSEETAPYAGAVVMVDFKTQNGRAMIVRIQRGNGRSVPFGAEVLNAKGDTLGIVGQDGRALLRGVDESGRLSVRWNREQDQASNCSFTYRMPQGGKDTGRVSAYTQLDATCRPEAVGTTSPKGGT
uniref:fimbria/pilus outer membrane usher protein n=1 Tax=Oleiagrimonas sp. TaxID=2010330 RepID=UPI0026214C96